MFFGGGTPSLVPAEALMRVLDHIPLARDAEVTVECNPDTVDCWRCCAPIAAAASTACRFGVQSMVPHVLASLGRTHDPANVTSSVAAARATGFDSFNLDLIYGAAGEIARRLALDARRRARARAAAHRAPTRLTVEPGTPLADEPDRHPDDDDQADKYLVADRMLAAAGLGWLRDLELGAARPRVPAQPPLLVAGGLPRRRVRGALASRRARWWNVRTPERYVEAITAGQSPIAASERLDQAERRIEALQLALRTPRWRADGRAARGARGSRGTQRRSSRADRARSFARKRGRVAAQLRGGSSKT